MDSDMQVLYDQYLSYFQDFQFDFDRHVGKDVGARFRATVLSFGEFCQAWHCWGQQGLQRHWRLRFELGYSNWSMNQVSRLADIFSNGDSRATQSKRVA